MTKIILSGNPCVQKLSNKPKVPVVYYLSSSLQYSLHFIYSFFMWWCNSLHSLIKLYPLVYAQHAADSTHVVAHTHP